MLWYWSSARICHSTVRPTTSSCTHRRQIHLLLERLPLLKREAVRLGDHGHDVDHLAELLHDNDVDRSKGVSGRVDEKQATVNSCVLDVAVTNGSELLAEVCAVLVLDVLDDRIPAFFDFIFNKKRNRSKNMG